MSSNNPNLQNIPIRTELGREIRSCFIAEPGHLLVAADYSQVELRLLAHIAGEEVLKEIFRRGEDVHTATAVRVFNVTPDEIDPGMRSKSKMINYGIVYGLSAWGMADRLDIPQEEANEFIERYLAGFPAVARWIAETIEQGTEHGYVSTLFGRRRQVPELRARRWEMRRQGERFAVNMVIQGTAADIMKVAMVRTDRRWPGWPAQSGWCSRSTTSCCSRGPAEEAGAVAAIAADGRGVRDGPPARRRRRGSAPTGWPPSSRRPGSSSGDADGGGPVARHEARVSDLQVVPEGPIEEAAALHRPERAGEQPRRDPRDRPLDVQHPAKRTRVHGREGVIARQRLLARLLAGEHRAQLPPARDPEVQRGPDSLGGQRQTMPGGVPGEEDPSSVASRSACGIQLPW